MIGAVQALAPAGEGSSNGIQIEGGTLLKNGVTELLSGATLSLASGKARLLLARGGVIVMCAPFRASFVLGEGDRLLISLQRGAMNLRYAADNVDSIITPDYRLRDEVPAGQYAAVSASMELNADGRFCLRNAGAAWAVTGTWAEAPDWVINGEQRWFTPGAGSAAGGLSCACAPPPPAPVITRRGPPRRAGRLFPETQNLTYSAGQRIHRVANPPKTGQGPRPATAKHKKNWAKRLLHWLFGRR